MGFTERKQAHSSFFILDHSFGDPEANSQYWCPGISTAVLQGLLSLSVCALPVVHGLFFEQYSKIVRVLVFFYLGSTMVFGAMYYHAMPYHVRQHALWPQQFLLAACVA